MVAVAPPADVGNVVTSADVWHRWLRHPNEAVVRTVAKIPETSVMLTDAMTKCDTCLVSKSFHRAHPKTTVHSAAAPLERVFTDLIRPISPAVKGTACMYVSKFSDELTRYKAFYLFVTKPKPSAPLCVQDLAIPYGRRVCCLCSDGVGEYRAAYFQNYIAQKYTAANTPQQNGIS